jgi:starvation-inducible outer membrane lipoprotein
MKHTILATAMVFGLAACGDKPQTLETSKRDSSAYSGTGKAYANPDWKQGDKDSWEAHLKARNQYGQNDYTRMN